jgi:hypothetical protein
MLISAALTMLVLLLLIFDALLFGSHFFSRFVGVKLHPKVAKPVLAGVPHETHNPVGIGIERAPRPRPDQMPIEEPAVTAHDPLLDEPATSEFDAEAESNTPLSELMKKIDTEMAVERPAPTKIAVANHDELAKVVKPKAKAAHHKKPAAKKKITISD